jgi:hypothetical protein
MKTTEQALAEAIGMLRLIAYGKSWPSMQYWERVTSYEQALCATPAGREAMEVARPPEGYIEAAKS